MVDKCRKIWQTIWVQTDKTAKAPVIGVVENEEKYRDYIASHLSAYPARLYFWNSAEEFWRDDKVDSLDLVLIDLNLVHMDGVVLTRMLQEKNPDILKIILTNLDSEEIIFQALKYGAVGYILKSELESLQNSIEIVLNGGGIISPTIACRVMNSFRREPGDLASVDLTDRERQVLEQLVKGISNAKAADNLGISGETVRWHVKNIYKKMNVRSKLELIRKCNELGFD